MYKFYQYNRHNLMGDHFFQLIMFLSNVDISSKPSILFLRSTLLWCSVLDQDAINYMYLEVRFHDTSNLHLDQPKGL